LLRNPPDQNALDNLVNELNNLLPLQITDLTETPPASADTETTAASKTDIPAPLPVAPAPAKPAPAADKPVPASPEVTAPPAPKKEPVILENKQNENKLNEKFRVEIPRLNERLAKPTGTNLAETQMSRKIESLKESISINQRFGFINELFNGENMEYHNAIKTLDEFKDAESAKNYVIQDLSVKHNWSKKEEHVNKLLRLIERKFA
jgi:hypothetical protein